MPHVISTAPYDTEPLSSTDADPNEVTNFSCLRDTDISAPHVLLSFFEHWYVLRVFYNCFDGHLTSPRLLSQCSAAAHVIVLVHVA